MTLLLLLLAALLIFIIYFIFAVFCLAYGFNVKYGENELNEMLQGSREQPLLDSEENESDVQ